MGLKLIYEKGQTPLSEEEMLGLKLPSVTTKGELDEVEQLNIEQAIIWTLGKSLTAKKLLSIDYVQQLHKRMYGDVWSWAGAFRQSEKNIGVPSYSIYLEVQKLLDDAMYWYENDLYDPQTFCITLKHRLVSIHCFPNGNGRHSRLYADLLHTHIYAMQYFSWRGSSLSHASDERNAYLTALKKADRGDIDDLIEFAMS